MTSAPAEFNLSMPDAAAVTETVRTAFSAAARNLAPRGPSYMPFVLRERRAALRLAVRFQGRLLAEHETADGVLLTLAAEAGAALGRDLLRRDPKHAATPEPLGLEIEIIGPPVFLTDALTPEGYWTQSLYGSFQAGRDGVGVDFKGRRGWVSPAAILASNFSPDLALQWADRRARLTPELKRARRREIAYYRFPAIHLWQPAESARPIRLVCGVVPVPADAVTAKELDRSLDELAAYCRYRRNRDGAFSYCYHPATDRYDDRNSATAQMTMLSAVLEYGRIRPDSQMIDLAEPLLRATMKNIQPLPGADDAAYVAFIGHEDKLGTTAMYLSALAAAPKSPGISDARGKLVKGLISTQNKDGSVGVADAAPKGKEGSANQSASAALLALARIDANTPNEKIQAALHLAVSHYRTVAAESPETTTVAWLSRAFALAYRRSHDPAMSDAAFAGLDRFVASQWPTNDFRRPECAGAIDLSGRAIAGIETADALAALADGVELARQVGDMKRAEQYRDAIRAAARLVLQLRFRPDECYYVRSPRDVLGGIRSSLWDSSIPIDNVARAMTGLLRARDILFSHDGETMAPRKKQPSS